ncbi:MAG: DUF2892 domain-containing protein [Rhodobacteraceae bacterium]|nr:DUF2892 domain-containing protein [Paracoccaceae bacterium]
MLKKNVGGIDRILRIGVGLALIAGFFLNSGGTNSWLYLIGIVPLLTGIFQTCALYTLLGINTCDVKK